MDWQRHQRIRAFGFGIGVLALLSSSGSTVVADMQSDETSASVSCRFVFPLNHPRRFASRFAAEKRLLEVRVLPARSQEFDATAYYDTRCIHRMVVREFPGEVILGLQLKNRDLGWLVTHKEDPWRLIIDIWPNSQQENVGLVGRWTWQDGLASEAQTADGGAPISAEQEFAQELLGGISAPGGVGNEHPLLPLDIPASHQSADSVVETSLSPVDVHAEGSSLRFPQGFGRVEAVVAVKPKKLTDLEQKFSTARDREAQFDSGLALALTLYGAGNHQGALDVLRRLASLWETRFRVSGNTLWVAGESAYLTGKSDVASDYFRTLIRQHPSSESAWLARMRLLDLALLERWRGEPILAFGKETVDRYAEIALSEKAPWTARCSSTVKILQGIVDENPQAAKMYQHILDNCSNNAQLAIETMRNSSYIGTRSSIEKMDAVSADHEVRRFEDSYADDPRGAVLREKVTGMAKNYLEESRQQKSWDAWVAFETNSRAGFLDFLDKDPEAVWYRAESFAAAGRYKKAAGLYDLYAGMNADAAKKLEARAVGAMLWYRAKENKAGEATLQYLYNDDERNRAGISERAVAAVRELAVSPYRSKQALDILMDELEAGRYVERKLETLVEYTNLLRGRPMAERIYEKILAFPLRTAGEVRLVEDVLIRYAQGLSDGGRLEKAGDIYMSVANISNGMRRGEAAYKAGIVYARAGLLEKARASWQQASSDLSDARYSTLANERLERIR